MPSFKCHNLSLLLSYLLIYMHIFSPDPTNRPVRFYDTFVIFSWNIFTILAAHHQPLSCPLTYIWHGLLCGNPLCNKPSMYQLKSTHQIVYNTYSLGVHYSRGLPFGSAQANNSSTSLASSSDGPWMVMYTSIRVVLHGSIVSRLSPIMDNSRFYWLG